MSSSPIHLDMLLAGTITVTEQVSYFIHRELGKVSEAAIRSKEYHSSLVSYVDTGAEERLVEGLSKLLPEAGFLTEEETTEQGNASLRWIIDPLDGTTNFLHQLPCFSISVALEQRGQTLLGVVHEVNRSETFSARLGGGCYLNGQQVWVSERARLEEALIATGFPYYDFSLMERYFKTLAEFMQRTRGIRRFGSAAVDLAYVACGRFDAFFEHSLHPWDVAAGALLVQEAGGRVTDFSGGDNYLHGREIFASSGALFEQAFPIIQHMRT